MTRLLFWGLIVACALIAVRMAVQRSQRPQTKHRDARAPGNPPKVAEAMVACAHCGVYLPSSEALVLHGQTWCCREHAEEHQQP